MSNFSDHTEANIINATLKGVAYPLPAGVFVALFTADPGEANSPGNEAAYTGYARVNSTMGAGWSAPSNGVSSNVNELAFAPNGGGSNVTITHMALMDAATGGNMLYWAPLTASKTLQPNDRIIFGAGSITVTVD